MLRKALQRIRKIFKNVSAKPKKCLAIVTRKVLYKKECLYIRIHHYRTVEMSVADLILKHSDHGELLRCDVVVRYLAIEEYYHKNNYGFALYRKMQDARIGGGYSEIAVSQFLELIASYENNGYDKNSGIMLDEKLNLIDGSHRIALALYHGIPNITANIVHTKHPVEYSVDWFIANGFSTEEVKLINKKCRELLKAVNKPFSCVIWSPAVAVSDQILMDLGCYGEVISVEKYQYRDEEYKNVVRAIYAIDDIEKWKVDKKLSCMEGYAPELIAVDVQFADPKYRIKSATGLPLSKQGERAKKALRAKYQKAIPNYFFDCIMHIADNQQQSEYMRRIFEPGINFKEVLELLDEYRYALIKVDVPHIPEDFPERIPSGKDIDILCAKEDFEAVSSKLSDFVDRQTDYEIVKRKSPDRLLLRYELSGKLVFQIDCCSSYEKIPDEFLLYALRSRKRSDKGYYVLDPAAEAIIRRVAFEGNKKTYHLEYYGNNKTEETELLFEKCGGGIDALILELREHLDASKIPYDSVCIVGSFTLALYGYRKAHDLDFVVSSKYAGQFPDSAVMVTENCEKVRRGWLRSSNRLVFSDDEIINDERLHFLYNGFKVARLPLVAYKKAIIRREKDMEDLKRIADAEK